MAQDVIDISNIKINNQVVISDSKSAFLSNLGQPQSTETIEYETEELTVDVLTYNQSTFSFASNDMIRFSIRDNSISITLNSISFTVGDNISLLQNEFSNSYNSISDTYNNVYVFILHLKNTKNGQSYKLDDWIAIGINQTTGVINSIHYVRP